MSIFIIPMLVAKKQDFIAKFYIWKKFHFSLNAILAFNSRMSQCCRLFDIKSTPPFDKKESVYTWVPTRPSVRFPYCCCCLSKSKPQQAPRTLISSWLASLIHGRSAGECALIRGYKEGMMMKSPPIWFLQQSNWEQILLFLCSNLV